ncbi:family 78 glycoside hydrolase catalytic domain [Paenibacillus sp. MWE-103]|uniref:Family 78 glycoside hydrolase catalytic domain n=1 Tax=Paenibacillus artemisiicola TaxID=1172618 RepID=A0ABS3W5Q5_9BACL|nr:family 78 glycoside hydrolase catalytic domain [Paenibacillus artemisiicola]MBO7743630.1 family 78 glycoside hydrolase catalytic domain [Paenibacillus artemisiicola]
MEVKQWRAKWIWSAGTAGENDVYVEARTTFPIEMKVIGAKLRISANQTYELSLNGTRVGRGPAPADLAWMSYDEYDVAACLREGCDNAIAILAHNFGTDRIVTEQLQGPGGLICQLDLSLEDEAGTVTERTVATDEGWRCRRSPRWAKGASRLHLWGGYREILDLSKEDGWERADYGDESWPRAVVVAEAEQPGTPWPRLIPSEIPRLRETLVRPVSVVSAEAFLGAVRSPDAVLSGSDADGAAIDASVPGSFPQLTYDFGKEIVGYPELEVEAEEGGVLQLYYGESLEVALMDTFLLRKGSNTLRPHGRRAFRYLKAAVLATPVPIRLRSLQAVFVHYPFRAGGRFVCSDERLNRIWETGRYTTIVNSQHHFEDCPYREQSLWVADSVVMAKVVYQTFGDAALARKSLLQAARIQNEDGSIAGTGPQRNRFLLPDFCAHWLFGVWEHYRHTGDDGFLREAWPHAEKLADWFAAQEDGTGLFANASRDGWWCFIDWTDDIERQDRVTALSCFYYKFLNVAALIAEQLNEPGRAGGFRSKAARLRAAVRAQLRVPGTSVYADCLSADGLSASMTAQTNFAAAWSGIMEEPETIRFVEDYYLEGRLPRIRGAFFYHIVLETLFRHGYAEEACRQIRDYWGAMLDRGATTWWETFDPTLPFPTVPSPYLGHTPTYLHDAIPVSFSHGWGASPTYLLTKEVLGVDASAVGTGAVVLDPAPVTGIDWAEGTVPTPHGDIQASWRRETDGSIRFRVQLPVGMAWQTGQLSEVAAAEEAGTVVVTGIVQATRKRAASMP